MEPGPSIVLREVYFLGSFRQRTRFDGRDQRGVLMGEDGPQIEEESVLRDTSKHGWATAP